MPYRLPRDKQKALVGVPYAIFCDENAYSDAIRRASLERVCLTMLRTVHTDTLEDFFVENIIHIMDYIEAKQIKVIASIHPKN